MSRMITFVCLLSLYCLFAQVVQATPLPPPVVTGGGANQVTASAALFDYPGISYPGSPHGTAHQQDCMTVAYGNLYVAFYDQDYHVCLARKNFFGDTWKIITFTNSLVPQSGDPADGDTHETPNVAVSPNDGRIHLAYGHHDRSLRYRMSSYDAANASDANFTTALFGAERDWLQGSQYPETSVTYPVFVTRESDGKLYLFWRRGASGHGDTYMADYLDNGTWSAKRKLIDGYTGAYSSSADRNAYPNDIATFENQIHFTWCWRETSSGSTNHDLMYVKSTTGGVSWTRTGGQSVSLPITLNSTGVKVWDINYDWSLINNGSSYVDGGGNTHVVLRHSENAVGGSQRYWHYARSGNTWTRTLMGDANGPFTTGRRPKLLVDRTTNTVYVIAAVASKLTVYAAQQAADTGESDWDKWTKVFTKTDVNYQNELNFRLWPGVSNPAMLSVLAQRTGTASSRLDIVTLLLDSDPTD